MTLGHQVAPLVSQISRGSDEDTSKHTAVKLSKQVFISSARIAEKCHNSTKQHSWLSKQMLFSRRWNKFSDRLACTADGR